MKVWITSAMLLGLALAVPVSSQAQTVGITDTTVKLGTVAPITGDPAIGMVADGIKLKFDEANAEGGVKMADGKTRTIEFVIADSTSDPARALVGTRRLIESDGVFALVGLNGTLENQAIRPYLDQAKVPNILVYSAVTEFADETKNPYTTMGVPSITTEGAIFVEHLKSVRPNAKVGILYFDSDFGLNFVAGVKKAAEGTGIEVVSVQPHGYADPTVDTQLTNIRAAGADTLLVVSIPKQSGQSILYARQSGWNPLIMITYSGSSVVALRPVGLENMQGVIADQFLKPVDAAAFADDAGVKRYLASYAQFKPRFEAGDTLGQMGYTIAEGAIAALQNMSEPTHEALLQSARHLDHVVTSLTLPGIELTTNGADDGFPIESLQLFEFKGEAYEPLGDIVSYEGRTPKL